MITAVHVGAVTRLTERVIAPTRNRSLKEVSKPQVVKKKAVRLDQVAKYIDVGRLHADAKDRWTRPENRSLGSIWLATTLASIVINALPGIIAPRERPQRSTSARASLCRALEIRAGCGCVRMILAYLFGDDRPRWCGTMTCLTVTART